MLVNLVPEFLATLAAPDPFAAYHEYLDRHRPVLSAYWQNYVLDPESPHAEPIIDAALRADRSDLKACSRMWTSSRWPKTRSAVRPKYSRPIVRSICTSWSAWARRMPASW